MRVALVTGGTRGIGAAISIKLKESGYKVAAIYAGNDEAATKFSKENKIAIFKWSIASYEECVAGINSVEDELGAIDILVNNAGILRHSPYLMTREEDLEEIFKINYFNTSFFTKKIIGTMIKNKNGSIINISSISGVTGNAGRSAYSASKAAIISETKVLSKELGFYNIKVNAIAPGLIDTEMLKHNLTEEEIEKIKDNISLRRIGKTQDVANTALFLGSDLSNYMTGQTLIIDGGM